MNTDVIVPLVANWYGDAVRWFYDKLTGVIGLGPTVVLASIFFCWLIYRIGYKAGKEKK